MTLNGVTAIILAEFNSFAGRLCHGGWNTLCSKKTWRQNSNHYNYGY